MQTILGLYRKVSALDTEAVIESAIVQTKEVIADLNAEQMNKGLRADGSEITPSYSPLTIAIKEEKGQPTDRVTLKDTGDYYKAIRVEVSSGGETKVINNDPKAEKLNKKYSKAKGNILGLSDPYRREYLNDHLRPTFSKNIEEAIGLKLK